MQRLAESLKGSGSLASRLKAILKNEKATILIGALLPVNIVER